MCDVVLWRSSVTSRSSVGVAGRGRGRRLLLFADKNRPYLSVLSIDTCILDQPKQENRERGVKLGLDNRMPGPEVNEWASRRVFHEHQVSTRNESRRRISVGCRFP